jgi:hypothetical protein
MVMQDVIEDLRQVLPPLFAGSKIGELTGGAIHWPTIQNKRSRREIPDECFIRSGANGRVLVRRDPFLAWWGSTLKKVHSTPRPQAPAAA